VCRTRGLGSEHPRGGTTGRLPQRLWEIHWVERRHAALQTREQTRRFADADAAGRQIASVRAAPWCTLQGVYVVEALRWVAVDADALPLSDDAAERYRLLGELARGAL
jgi:hypothetical protein